MRGTRFILSGPEKLLKGPGFVALDFLPKLTLNYVPTSINEAELLKKVATFFRSLGYQLQPQYMAIDDDPMQAVAWLGSFFIYKYSCIFLGFK